MNLDYERWLKCDSLELYGKTVTGKSASHHASMCLRGNRPHHTDVAPKRWDPLRDKHARWQKHNWDALSMRATAHEHTVDHMDLM